jgi:hypothetical protein
MEMLPTVVGLGELTPVVIGFPLTRKRANVLSKLSAIKTGAIDQDPRKGTS